MPDRFSAFDESIPDLSASHPVPEEQQPMQEYEQLRQSGFFRWATLALFAYLRGAVWVWMVAFALATPLTASVFPLGREPLHFLLSTGASASLVLSLAVARLFLGWSYVRQRLYKAAIVYEESGWYDGEVWVKPAEELAKDRLVVDYQIRPIMRRLYRTIGVLVAVNALGAAIWWAF
ncbi:MAG: CGLD27 family protein [Cyanobacteria bacterium J06642_2]